MVEGIVKKIMITGIEKYAKEFQTPVENVSIKVTDNPDGNVFFTMCQDMREVKSVSFLNIMDKKIDFLGYEGLATPVLKKTLEIFANEQKCETKDVSLFIVKHKNTVGLAFYNLYKQGKAVTLSAQLKELGL